MDIPFIDWGLFNQYVYGTRNPILLFPKGAPGETIKLIEKADTDGGKPVVRVFCVLRM